MVRLSFSLFYKINRFFLAALLLSLSVSAHAALDARDELIIDANEAFKKNDWKSLQSILPKVAGHPMEPWVHYWAVRSRLRQASPEEIRGVFQKWPGSYVEDRLRNDWLLILGERADWETFAQEYKLFVMRDDSQVLCYALLVDHKNKHNAVALAREEFLKIRPAYVKETGCNKLAQVLYTEKHLPEKDIWIKARRLVELNRIASTQKAIEILGLNMDRTINDLMKDPEKWLQDQKLNTPSKVAASHQELVTLALVRLAAKNPELAIKIMSNDWKDSLSAEQRAWVYAVAGRITAIRLNPKAVDYFNLASKAKDLNVETIEWEARARLRAADISKKISDWQKLITAIDAMPEDLRKSKPWVFWKAIALKRTHSNEPANHPLLVQAQGMLESIAGQDGFYPQLATEELGLHITLPAQPQVPTDKEMNEAMETPGLMRALYALNLGLRSESTREWNWNLRGKSDRFLQAASQLACDQHVWDRCINTSERAQSIYNARQRYPMPYHDIVVPRAYELKMDPSYVFGLIRQESRFIADIKSAVGATGLMQLMPATAKWTAKEIGMTDYTPEMMKVPERNIQLGTAYLNLSLEEFNGSQAMAAAAYNAGPGRPRNWRKGATLDGAVWAENIPFNETRSYVQTVLPAAVIYELLLTGQPQSLRARLGTIGPATDNGVKRADLP